jgi:hypothetical protein
VPPLQGLLCFHTTHTCGFAYARLSVGSIISRLRRWRFNDRCAFSFCEGGARERESGENALMQLLVEDSDRLCAAAFFVPPLRGLYCFSRLPTLTASHTLASVSTPSRESRACWGPRGVNSFAPPAGDSLTDATLGPFQGAFGWVSTLTAGINFLYCL